MSDFAVSEPARTGATVGVEEEFHVVDPESMELRDSPELVALLAADDLGPRVHSELSTTQIETASRVCTSLDDVRRELRAGRSAAAAAAGQVGATVLAASTHPFSSWHEQRVTHTPATCGWSSAGRSSRCSRTSAGATSTSTYRTWTPRSP